MKATTTGEEKPKVRWWTIALAVSWVVVFIAIASIAPVIREMFEELGSIDDIPILKTTRAVVRVPPVAYTLTGLLVAAALVWKSRTLSRR